MQSKFKCLDQTKSIQTTFYAIDPLDFLELLFPFPCTILLVCLPHVTSFICLQRICSICLRSSSSLKVPSCVMFYKQLFSNLSLISSCRKHHKTGWMLDFCITWCACLPTLIKSNIPLLTVAFKKKKISEADRAFQSKSLYLHCSDSHD